MGTLPDSSLEVKNGSLGLSAQDATQTVLKVGTSSAGVANVVKSYATKAAVQAELGSGPLVEALCRHIDVAGGPVLACKIDGSVAGAAGAVTKVGTGLSVMTVAGAPFDGYQVKVQIIQGAANPAAASATFRYSLDNGLTYSAELALPSAGSYAIPGTNLTLTFSAASLVAGDVYSFTCTAPGYTTGDLSTTLTAIQGDSTPWFLMHLIGRPPDAATAAAVFSAVALAMSNIATAFRYAAAVMDGLDDTDANVKAAYAASSDDRAMVGGGCAALTSSVNGSAARRSVAWVASERAAACQPKEDLGKVLLGAVKGVVQLYRDETATPGLDADGFVTLRTLTGLDGFWITQGRMKTGATSDYKLLQNRRVMDIGSTAVRAAQLKYLNGEFATNDDGTIREQDARAIENDVLGKMRNVLTRAKQAVDVQAVVDRSINLLSTEEIDVAFTIQPFGYAKHIKGSIGFTNPNLVLK